eukprot:CAMPEP_0197834650 /NCGR_PEP_ID=MMETSP1437-20131217/23192_1 /TAXON_ID=49252 ORGANISM="Eucampia antarctica, Strain CCMP1452" /NCGR_SAMPLE_ID=MMETSP1437 /ASSEMBLY_ACC=CAM_ASM_001096 /LENGTH=333 /DNA_ID=CAMNT_0043439511 /DNA_START=19 /DNA_END=1021 /DNA_ORIENTATION=-
MVIASHNNSPSIPIPPVSPYGTFHGSLFQYSSSLIAFESSPSPPLLSSPLSTLKLDNDNDDSVRRSKKCILLGGLSDGLIPTPYTQLLERACHEVGWDLVQPLTSSSYTGFGHGSLTRDTFELNALMEYLTHHRNADIFAIVGHSTGCQNSIHFLKHGHPHLLQKTKVVALQAPVSDREGAMLEPGYKENIKQAQMLVESGKAEEMMPRDAFWAPITAQRFISLQDTNGDDDFFSSDSTDEQMIDRLSHVGRVGQQSGLQLIAAFSGKDEYVPDHVDKEQLLERMCQAMNNNNHDIDENNKTVASKLMLHNGNHNLSKGENDAHIFVKAVKKN